MELSHIKLVIFDLDGTLYEDTHHFDYYANQLKQRLPQSVQANFQKDYEAALRDEHPLRIGRTYDVNRKLILVQIKGHVQEAYEWDGTKLSSEQVRALYPNGVTVNLEDMLSIGDLWWVPGAIARYYGLTDPQTSEAFLATREYMMGPDFHMTKIPGLQDAIQTARTNGVKIVLVTNSPQPDSEKILSKLGLSESFDEKVFQARKPSGTKAVFEKIHQQFAVPFTSILSIGDNWVNEILPANELSCQTIYIDAHHIGDDLECTERVASMQEALRFLEQAGLQS